MSFSCNCFLNNPSLGIKIYNRIDDVDAGVWNQLLPEDKLYLSLPYLKALEDASSGDVIFRYVIFSHKNYGPVGICNLQILDFKGATNEQQNELCFIARKIKDKIAESNGLKVITCGNVFACGENGFAFSDKLDEQEVAEAIADAIKQVQKEDKKNFNSSLFLLKEFWPRSLSFSDRFKTFSYTGFSADVNMVLNINDDWQTYEDYLGSMQAKFRTKANAAEKRSQELVYKTFSVEDIELLAPEIEKLFTAVVAKSPYSFGTLNAKAFANFKRNLGEQFIFNGYLLDGRLVAFSTAFAFDGIIDANYVGINYKLNQHYALYPRMLYDFVRLAIERRASELRLGRTAEEIKSSIGAVPVDMKLYVRHKTTISNHLVKPFFSGIKPSPFELRRPFKLATA